MEMVNGVSEIVWMQVDFFKDTFQIFSKVVITDEEAILYGRVLLALQEICEKEKITKEDIGKAAIIFSDNGSFGFNITEDDGNTFGYRMNLIIYAMDKIRNAKQSCALFKMIIFAEELAHFVWPMLNEVEIKTKVVEILKPIEPDISLELLKSFGVLF